MTPDDVIEFWFGSAAYEGAAPPEVQSRWWKKDAAFDAEIATRFGETHTDAVRGALNDWFGTARGRLALVIVIDQFSRQMFRGDRKSWAWDRRALEIAMMSIKDGMDRELTPQQRVFLYMPLMHSEDRTAHELSIEVFSRLAEEAPAIAANNVNYAQMHKDIVDRFGRYPHRNSILGRESTPEELEFLTQPGSSF